MKYSQNEKNRRNAIIVGGVIVVLLIVAAILLAVLLPRNSGHTKHTYDNEVVEAKYLKSPATHASGKVYYKSCKCGKFSSTGPTFIVGEPVAHTYDKEVAAEAYLKTAATHTEGATYYKSCECGAKGTDEDTFEYGYYLPTEGLVYSENPTTGYTIMGTGEVTDAHIVIADQIDGIPVTAINVNAFGACSWLQSIVIPDSVTNIGMSAFMGCSNLTSVKLSNSLKEISSNIFNGCTQLQSIVIPDRVTTIGGSAFNNCPSLTAVYYTGTEEDWNEITIANYNESLMNATVYYYVENEADVPADDGNYWHYDTDGITPVIWTE